MTVTFFYPINDAGCWFLVLGKVGDKTGGVMFMLYPKSGGNLYVTLRGGATAIYLTAQLLSSLFSRIQIFKNIIEVSCFYIKSPRKLSLDPLTRILSSHRRIFSNLISVPHYIQTPPHHSLSYIYTRTATPNLPLIQKSFSTTRKKERKKDVPSTSLQKRQHGRHHGRRFGHRSRARQEVRAGVWDGCGDL